MIALIPILVLFVVMQKRFFKGKFGADQGLTTHSHPVPFTDEGEHHE